MLRPLWVEEGSKRWVSEPDGWRLDAYRAWWDVPPSSAWHWEVHRWEHSPCSADRRQGCAPTAAEARAAAEEAWRSMDAEARACWEAIR